MGRFSISTCVVLLMCCFTAKSWSAEEPKILFRATFDESKIDTDVAGGSAKGTVVNSTGDAAAKLEFDRGLTGRGTALVIGDKSIGVSYDLKGNIDRDRGSLSYWFRRVGPRPHGGRDTLYRYDVLSLDGADTVSLWLYKWEHFINMTFLRLERGGGKNTIVMAGDADDGNWHFITLTWSGRQVWAYMDGAVSGGQEDVDLPKFEKLVIGDFHDKKGDEATRRLVDDVTIYADALTSSDIKRMYRRGRGLDAPVMLTIPPRKQAITIDGKITSEEWAGAVRTTGFADLATGLSAATQTSARLCYDDEALYIALSSDLPARVKDDPAMTIGMTGGLRQTKTDFDSSVDSDDSFEIQIEPAGMTDRFCRLVVNGLNTHYDYDVTGDYRQGKTGVIRLAWNPKWQSATTFDGEGWHAEFRIPFSAFEMPGPKPGDTWGLSLVRRWVALQSEVDGWGFGAMGQSDNSAHPHATTPIRFGSADTPVIALEKWGNIAQGDVDLDAMVANPGGQDVSLKVEIATDSPELKEIRELTIPKHGSVPVELTRRLKDFTTSQVMMTVSSGAGETLFRSGQLLSIPEELRVQTAVYPTDELYRVTVDAGRLSNLPLGELSLQVQMLDSAGKPTGVSRSISPLPSYRCDAELNIASLAAATYSVKCSILHKDKPVFERTIEFVKRPMPEWYGNSLGITDKAPAPFTPVTRKDDTLGCWERTYDYAGGFLPRQITTKGNAILTRPIELQLTDAAGKTVSSITNPARTWGKHTDFRIEYKARGTLGEAPLAASSWMECDGLVWTHLSVGKAGDKINKLVLRIPIHKEWAKYVNTSDYSVQRDGFLSPKGIEGSFPTLWLGNGYGGLQWIVESYAACRLPKGAPALRVIPGDNETVLEITLIGEPVVLEAPFEQEFGLIATPVRPPTPGYRGWNTYTSKWLPEVAWNDAANFEDWKNYTTFIFNGIPPDLKEFLRILRRPDSPEARQHVTVQAPQVMVGQISADDPTFAYWGDEWSPSANGRKITQTWGITAPASRSWQDFFLWNYNQIYKRARMPGVYYDCDMEPNDDNPYHGGGLKINGHVIAQPSILGTRRLVQRMYVMLRNLEPERTMIAIHASGFLNLAYMGWADLYIDGENFTSLLNKQNQDYHKLYPPDKFLAKSMGHNTGLTVRFLDEQMRAHAVEEEDWAKLGLQPTLQIYGLVLLHDSVLWHAAGNQLAYKVMNDALMKYNFDDRYRVVGWYFDQKIVALPDKVFATFYKDDSTGRILIVLLNNNEKELNLELALDWKALGISDPNHRAVDDALFHQGASIRDGKLITPIGAANTRLIVIQPAAR